jgi:hypothetical protein
MIVMKRYFPLAVVAAIAILLSAAPIKAQIIGTPGSGALIVPPPPAPPPPSMAVPVVPKLDELPRAQGTPQPRGSFGDRMTNCLQDGAAAGLGPNDRAAYSRACANR